MRKSKFPLRDRNARDYGEMGSNPWRTRRGKKRGMKAGKQKRPKKVNIDSLLKKIKKKRN